MNCVLILMKFVILLCNS